MKKVKKKKKDLSEMAVHSIKKAPKKLNAFEMHINRRKFNIIGMKQKAEKGLPGISRSRAIKKRKATLLQEYKIRDKKNTFLDRRIGERNSAMTSEDKMMARFTAERIKFHSKKSLFNLGDSEELTHRGESLTEIEKYDDPKSDDEYDDDDDDGKLDRNFVGEAHFGGGILKKIDGESKSRKDLIEELISESKKRKAEKQRLKEQTYDLTQKLDSEWKELLPLVTAANKGDTDVRSDGKNDNKSTSYDKLSKQLMFEARGKPMDRLKSEEEIAKEEKEKLEAMEQERISRMLGENKKRTPKHRSADDMDDGFDLDEGPDFILNYKSDGLPNVPSVDGVKVSEDEKGQSDEGSDAEEEEEEEDDDDGDGDDDDDDDDDDEAGDEPVEAENEGADDSDNESVDLSEFKQSDDSDDELPEDNGVDRKRKKTIELAEGKRKESDRAESGKGTDPQSAEEIEKLPYTFEIPNDYDSFERLMINSSSRTRPVIIERMVKCNHPSLKDSNKDKLDALFTFLLQHLEDSASDTSREVSCFQVLESISPFLYDLAHWNPGSSLSAMMAVVKEKYADFLKQKKTYPGLDTLVFLKLVNLLFSTSDYRHRVAIPAMIFMEQILSSCRILSSVDISTGLFISTLMLEFCSFSKRFAPEVFNFVRGTLRLGHPKEFDSPLMLPFKVQDMDKFNLIVKDKTRSYSVGQLESKVLWEEDNSDDFKVKSIALSLRILSELVSVHRDKPAAVLLFEPFIPLLNGENFCDSLKNDVGDVLDKILALRNEPLERLVKEVKRPKPLRLYEPRIEEIYSLKKYKPMSKEKQERAKLRHKYKREMKGALREIRRDSSFLAKLKFNEMRKSDMERQRKVREILGSVADQTGEVRKLKRKK